jgi:hypothetical protein
MEKEKVCSNIENHSDTDLPFTIVLTLLLVAFGGLGSSNISEIEKELSELKGKTDVIEKLVTNE